MKRIVTIVLPVIEKDAAESGASVHGPSDLAEVNLASIAAGATKVEVVVSDDEAGRILSVVLGGLRPPERELGEDVDPEDQTEIEQLVRHELRSADPTAINLLDQIMERIERVLIEQVYSECHHVKSRAAIRLGINRNTLLKKLRRFGVLTDEEHVAALQDES